LRADISREDAPEDLVGRARWTDSGVEIVSDDDRVRASIERVFRPMPVATDDPSLRPAGSSGPVVLPPGSLSWFVHAARSRSGAEGLAVRLVAEDSTTMGWDPAAAYRTFWQTVERKARTRRAAG
jgi:hypothetical protein